MSLLIFTPTFRGSRAYVKSACSLGWWGYSYEQFMRLHMCCTVLTIYQRSTSETCHDTKKRQVLSFLRNCILELSRSQSEMSGHKAVFVHYDSHENQVHNAL